MINTDLLRQLWTIVETSPTEVLINLTENELVNWLSVTLQQQQFLTEPDSEALKSYLSSRTTLIRDLAEERL